MRIPKKLAMKRVGVFIGAVALLMSTGLVAADSLGIDFESPDYEPGSIDGQEGWAGMGGIPINPAVDQAIVTNGASAPGAFGEQSWRFSNAYTDGAFGTWPFSPSLTEEAGETDAEGGGLSTGPRQNRFEVEFSFASFTQTPQAGLQMSTAPDRGDGARMSFLRLEDLPDGLSVDFADYQDNEPYGTFTGVFNPDGCGVEDVFAETTVATGLSRSEAHTVKLTIDFVDGPRNDIVKVYINGELEHTGTSWEDYFRYCEGNPPRTVDSMIFQARSGGGTAPLLLGLGFLIDNLSYESFSASVPGNAQDCKDGGWMDLADDEGEPFKNQGQCLKYVRGADEGATIVVTPTNQQGWSTADTRPGGTVEFVADADAPGGDGALELTTDATTAAKAQYLHEANTPLADVTELSYWTKQVSGPPHADPSYQVITCLTGEPTATSCPGFTTLVFEPYQGGLPQAIVTGVWQEWNVDEGLFWSTRTVTCSIGTIVGTSGGPATYTLEAIQTACPDAVVAGFGVNIGTFNPGYVVRTDLFNFNGTVYDFELNRGPHDACRDGGWQDEEFRNQGQCIKEANAAE